MRKYMKLLPMVFVALIAGVLAGCGDSLPSLGEKSDSTAQVVVENGLGVTVTQIQLRQTGTEDWSEGILTSDQTLEADAKANLYYDSAYATDGDVDVQVTAQDGTMLVFEGVDLGAYQSMTLLSGDGVSYVDFTGTDKETGSTKQAALDAKAAKEEAEKKAAEEEAAKKAAEEEAAKKAAEEEAAKKAAEEEAARKAAEEAAAASASSSQSYSGGSSSSSQSSGSGSSSSAGSSSDSASAAAAAPAQSEDRCLDDPIFND
jgi:uncharacterized membrane protein YgcG